MTNDNDYKFDPIEAIRNAPFSPAGKIVYVSHDNSEVMWPGEPNWNAENGVKLVDLVLMRMSLVNALYKVEDALEEYGLLHRVTPDEPRRPMDD